LFLRDSHGDIRRIDLVEEVSGLVPTPGIVPTDILEEDGTAIGIWFAIPAETEGVTICSEGDIPLACLCLVLRAYEEAIAVEVDILGRSSGCRRNTMRCTLDCLSSRSRAFAQVLHELMHDLRTDIMGRWLNDR
jgi:hypothetical protein